MFKKWREERARLREEREREEELKALESKYEAENRQRKEDEINDLAEKLGFGRHGRVDSSFYLQLFKLIDDLQTRIEELEKDKS
jgi:hypothetical protein